MEPPPGVSNRPNTHVLSQKNEHRPYRRPVIWALVVIAGIIFGVWLSATPPGVLGKADAVGYAVCHRIEERSFHVHDRPLPMCARCTGIFLGVITGLIVFIVRGRVRAGQFPPLRVLGVLGLFGAAYVLDGLNSYLSLFDAYTPLYQPHNTLRLVTGALAGLAMITIALPAATISTWAEPLPLAPVVSLREIGLLVLCAAPVIGLVLLELPAVLVLAGVISAIGVVFMFALIGSVLFVTVMRRENTVSRWRDLTLPWLGGLVFGISVIGLIDLVRYITTGTWGGFDITM